MPMAKKGQYKSPKEAFTLFESIIKASVAGNPKPYTAKKKESNTKKKK